MRVLMISTDGFEDTELLVPYYRLREAQVDVDLAAPERGKIEGKHGYSIEANRGIGEVRADDYDMLVLPGGKAPAKLREDERVLAMARKFFDQHKPVGAICHGPQILASAGLLQGRTATAWESVQKEIADAGGNAKDAELVVDGNLFTSRKPEDLPAFTREMMRRLGAA